MLSVVVTRLPAHIIKVLRMRAWRAPNVQYVEGAFSHNFGDFFFYGDFTIIR